MKNLALICLCLVFGKAAAVQLNFDKATYQSGDAVAISFQLQNKTDKTDVSFSIGNAFAENSFQNVIVSSHSEGLVNNGNKLTWHGELAPARLQAFPFSKTQFGYIPLQDTFGVEPQACRINCVDDIWHWQFPFTWQGEQVTDIYITRDGQVFLNDPTAPQALIMPLFNSGLDATREVRFTELFSSQTNAVYLVIEWSVYTESKLAQRYQLIVSENTEQLWFNYVGQQTLYADTSSYAQTENALLSFDLMQTSAKDLIASTQEFDNTTFLIETAAGGKLTLTADMLLEKVSLSDEQQVWHTQEEAPISGSLSKLAFIKYEICANSESEPELCTNTQAEFQFTEQAQASLLTPAENGEISLEHNQFSYLPNNDFFGSDSFEVEYSDGKVVSEPQKHQVEVTNINDAPQLTIEAPNVALSLGKQYILKAEVTDSDSQQFNYYWQVLSAHSVKLSQSGSELSFELLNDNILTPLVIELVVTDGDLEATSRSVLAIEQKESKSSGSSSYLLIFLSVLFVRLKNSH